MPNDQIDWKSLRILTLDDDVNIRRLIIGILRNLDVGSTPMTENAQDAYYEIENSAIDIVIVNRILKGADGFEFVKRMRSPTETPGAHTPIIMICKDGSLSIVTKAIKQGVDHYMVHPIAAKDLGQTIENLLTKPLRRIKTPTFIGPCRRLPQRVYGPFKGNERREEELVVE
jgi:PleD family two-component response regulator